jgi:Divergent InlB B-repeat domain
MRMFLACALLEFCLTYLLSAQTIGAPSIRWDVHYGGTNIDVVSAIEPTPDGGFLVAGTAGAGSGGTKQNPGYGYDDFWIVRLDTSGSLLWERTFGGSWYDTLTCVAPASDGGFLLGGNSQNGVNSDDFRVIRIDASGNQMWERFYGSYASETLVAIKPTSDGGFILAGNSSSAGGSTNKTSPNWGGGDFWIVKIDSYGNRLWDQSFGSSDSEALRCLEPASDGGFFLGGYSQASGGNKTSPAFGATDYWVVRVDQNGNRLWDISFGGSSFDRIVSIKATSDGGCILLGTSESPADGNKTSPGPSGLDSWLWLVRVDSGGNKVWDRTVGTGGEGNFFDVDRTPDGGLIVAGQRTSNRFDYFPWLLRLNSEGATVWSISYPGTYNDSFLTVRTLSDGSFVLGGQKPYAGTSTDYRVMRLNPELYPLVLVTNAPGRGLITLSPSPDFNGRYPGGTYVTLTAAPSPGNEFVAWRGGVCTSSNPVTIFMNRSMQVIADFAVTSGAPIIACSPTNVSLYGGDAVSNAFLSVWNAGTGVLDYELTSDQTWMTIDSKQSISVGETNLHTIKFALSTLPPGIHRAKIAITGKGLPGNPHEVETVLRIQASNPPPIQWQREYGGSGDEGASRILETPDGGFLIGAVSTSTNGDKSSPYYGGGGDFWVIRLNRAGDKLWDRSFGATGAEDLRTMIATADGGFLLGGSSDSPPSGNKTSPLFGYDDYWIVKVDADGNKLWDKSFGGTAIDEIYAMKETTDGGFLLIGDSQSPAGTGNKAAATLGFNDLWVVRIDSNGNKLWDKSYGGTSQDSGATLDVLPNGNMLLGGYSRSLAGTGSKTSPKIGNADFWVTLCDPSGNPIWDRSYGGTNIDFAQVILGLEDGFVIGGRSDGPGGSKTAQSFGNADYWLVRADRNGNAVWDRSYGSNLYDELSDIVTMPDGGFILGGTCYGGMGGNKTSQNIGGPDFWVVRTDQMGNKIWEKAFGTQKDDYLYSLLRTHDGGLVMAGYTITNSSPPYHAKCLIIKLAPESPKILAQTQSQEQVRTNGYRFNVLVEPNRPYIGEFSEDLVLWHPFATNLATDIEMTFLDPSPSPSGQRFYRARRDDK